MINLLFQQHLQLLKVGIIYDENNKTRVGSDVKSIGYRVDLLEGKLITDVKPKEESLKLRLKRIEVPNQKK